MTYQILFRKKVLKIKAKENLSFVEVAKKFNLSKTTIFEWSKKLSPQKNRTKKPTEIDDDILKKDIEQYTDSYCHERAERLEVSATGIRDARSIV